jgi:hypothetical protein
MSSEEEQQVCDALINLGWLETEQALHGEGVSVIRGLRQCTSDEAKAILQDLRMRRLIDLEITPGGQLDARKPMPVAQWRWIRLAAHH